MKHIHKSAIGDTLTFNFEIPDGLSARGVRAAANISNMKKGRMRSRG